jgi:hypothetical protein
MSQQLGLPLEQIEKPDAFPEGYEPTMAERFEAFHRRNPQVIYALTSVARDLKRQGFRTASINLLFERLRWLYAVKTHGDHYRLNNNYRAFYARLIMAAYPDLGDFFRVREQEVDYIPNLRDLGLA